MHEAQASTGIVGRFPLVAAVVLCAALAACASTSTHPASPATTRATTTAPTAAPATTPPTVPASRPVTVHVPPAYRASTPAPLLVLLHGYGASGAIQDAYMGLTAAADAHGLLYVHPDGLKNGQDKRYWNATDACCAPPGATVDDSAYLTAVIAQVEARFNVDRRRVFIVGHSNGGFMSYRMACDHADVVAAIVSIEGATFADRSRCRPTQPVAVLEVHGTGDDTVPYGGGRIAGHRYPGAVASVQTWAAYDRCAPTPAAATSTPHPLEVNRPAAVVQTYSLGCAAGGDAELWTVPGGVHIPIWSATFDDQIIGFLLAHPKPVR